MDKAKKKKPRGQPSLRSPELADKIMAWISSGKTMREFCRKPGHPSHVMFYDWLKEDEGFALRFAQAREVGHDAIADDALAMSDEKPPKVGGKVDQGYVAWVRNRVWTRLQLLAKWNPRKYGDRVAVTDAEGAPLRLSNSDAVRELALLFATAQARQITAKREAEAVELEEEGNRLTIDLTNGDE